MNRPVRVGRGADGNVTVLVTAFIVVAMMLGGAVARLGGAVVEKSRASNAADAAALAAAGVLARGRSPSDACAVARTTAADNGARLETCRAAASFAQVTVMLRDARAQARAQLDAPTDDPLEIEGRAQSGITYATPGSGRIDSSP
jgi:secretion/DNA translocation related TadE-like protein